MTELVALALVFVIVSVAAFALMAALRPRAEDELSEDPARRSFGGLTPAVGGMVPTTKTGRDRLQADLWLAGHYEPAALDNFLAKRSLLTILPLILGLLIAIFAPSIEWLMAAVALGVVGAVLGYALPTLSLRAEGKERAEAIRRGIPMFMDTLGMCLSTGNGLRTSFARSGEAIKRGYPDLTQEVRVTSRHAELRSMEHALDHFRRRIPLPEIGSLVFLLSQSDKLGTDVTKGLWELSSSYRVSARQNAETAANRVSFWMLFPTVFCLLAAAAIILVGPGFLEMYYKSLELRSELNNASLQKNDMQSMLDRAQQGKRLVNPPPATEPRPELAPEN